MCSILRRDDNYHYENVSLIFKDGKLETKEYHKFSYEKKEESYEYYENLLGAIIFLSICKRSAHSYSSISKGKYT